MSSLPTINVEEEVNLFRKISYSAGPQIKRIKCRRKQKQNYSSEKNVPSISRVIAS